MSGSSTLDREPMRTGPSETVKDVTWRAFLRNDALIPSSGVEVTLHAPAGYPQARTIIEAKTTFHAAAMASLLADRDPISVAADQFAANPRSDAEPIEARAVEMSRAVYGVFMLVDLIPSKIAPVSDGGLALCFYQGTKYADVECYNDGAIVATMSPHQGATPMVWEVDDLADAVNRIATFLAND